MTTVNITEAKSQLPALIRKAQLGEEVIITKGKTPVATITPIGGSKRPRQPGSAKDQVLYMAPDFDEIPEGFEEYI